MEILISQTFCHPIKDMNFFNLCISSLIKHLLIKLTPHKFGPSSVSYKIIELKIVFPGCIIER